MTKADFYKNKSVIETEWWLNVESFPELVWGRLRVYSDGTADACFAEGVTLYGFENREHAANLLATDDLSNFSSWGDEEEEEGRKEQGASAAPAASITVGPTAGVAAAAQGAAA